MESLAKFAVSLKFVQVFQYLIEIGNFSLCSVVVVFHSSLDGNLRIRLCSFSSAPIVTPPCWLDNSELFIFTWACIYASNFLYFPLLFFTFKAGLAYSLYFRNDGNFFVGIFYWIIKKLDYSVIVHLAQFHDFNMWSWFSCVPLSFLL